MRTGSVLIPRFLLVLALGLPAAMASGQDTVRVVLSSSSGIYQETLESFRARLQEISARPQAMEIISLPDGMPQELAPAQGPVIAIGAQAAEVVAGEVRDSRPAINILIPHNAHRQIIRQSRTATAAAIVLDQPVTRQLDLIRLLLPEARRVGVLLGPNSSALLDELQREAERRNLELVSTLVTEGADPVPAIRTLLDGTDVILAVNDPVVLDPTTSKWLLYMAYKKRVPVIGFSEAYTRAGALASLYSTPAQIGRQAAELLVQGGLKPGSAVPPAYFRIDTNESVARLLGIELPDAAELANRMGATGP